MTGDQFHCPGCRCFENRKPFSTQDYTAANMQVDRARLTDIERRLTERIERVESVLVEHESLLRPLG